MTMVGANAADPIQCTLGLACNLAVTGAGLTSESKVAVVNGACGSGTVAAILLTTDTGTTATYTGIITAASLGSHTLCWGHSPGDSTAASDFTLTVTTAEIFGPAISAFDCTLTKACTFVISGTHLAATNKIAIVDGECGSATTAT